MRPQFLLTLLLILTGPLHAQPILNGAYAPTAGERFTFGTSRTRTIALPEGPNQDWTYTFIAGGTTYPCSVDSARPANTPTVYAAATWLYHIGTSNVWMREADTGLIYLGNYYGGYHAPNPPVTFFPYGLAFGQGKVQHYYEIDTTTHGGNYTVDTVVYAGYGTLTLNGRVFSDCVLITSHTAGYSSPDTTTSPFALAYVHTEKLIYAPHVGYTLIDYTEEYTPGSTAPAYRLYYINNLATSLAPPKAEVLRLWPSPATGSVCLTVPGASPYSGPIAIYTVAGRHIATLPCHAGRADVSHLLPGLYMVETGHEGRVFRSRLVRE